MRNCFVPKCDNTCKNKPRRMMFMAPKDAKMFQLWKDVLPKKREFKRIDKVCERHFTKDDILTTFDHIINGELLQMERGRPRLKVNAVPSLNLDVVSTAMNKPIIKRPTNAKANSRKIMRKEKENTTLEQDPEIVSSSSNAKRTEEFEKAEPEVFECSNAASPSKDDGRNHTRLETVSLDEFESLYDDVFEVTLPGTLWGIHREPERQFIAFTFFDVDAMQNTKAVILNCNGSLKVVLNGKVISEQTFCQEITPESMSNILNEVEETLCLPRSADEKSCGILSDDSDDEIAYS